MHVFPLVPVSIAPSLQLRVFDLLWRAVCTGLLLQRRGTDAVRHALQCRVVLWRRRGKLYPVSLGSVRQCDRLCFVYPVCGGANRGHHGFDRVLDVFTGHVQRRDWTGVLHRLPRGTVCKWQWDQQLHVVSAGKVRTCCVRDVVFIPNSRVVTTGRIRCWYCKLRCVLALALQILRRYLGDNLQCVHSWKVQRCLRLHRRVHDGVSCRMVLGSGRVVVHCVSHWEVLCRSWQRRVYELQCWHVHGNHGVDELLELQPGTVQQRRRTVLCRLRRRPVLIRRTRHTS